MVKELYGQWMENIFGKVCIKEQFELKFSILPQKYMMVTNNLSVAIIFYHDCYFSYNLGTKNKMS